MVVSRMIPLNSDTFVPRLGVPLATAAPPTKPTSTRPAFEAPTSWAIQ